MSDLGEFLLTPEEEPRAVGDFWEARKATVSLSEGELAYHCRCMRFQLLQPKGQIATFFNLCIKGGCGMPLLHNSAETYGRKGGKSHLVSG